MPLGEQSTIQLSEPRFAVFKSPAWGFRAAIVLLRNYWRKHQIDTVEGLVARWAPPEENNTANYIEAVSAQTGYAPDQALNMENGLVLAKLARAFATEETGAWEPYWNDSQLLAGAALAGFNLTEGDLNERI